MNGVQHHYPLIPTLAISVAAAVLMVGPPAIILFQVVVGDATRKVRKTTHCSTLDPAFVFATYDAEEAALTPIGVPAVSDHPVGDTAFLTPTDQLYGMSSIQFAALVHVDAALVVEEVLLYLE